MFVATLYNYKATFVTLFNLMHSVLPIMRENNEDIIFNLQYFFDQQPYNKQMMETFETVDSKETSMESLQGSF